jgi:ornithine cyclodeaminase/alanine dehydrogenase-like protein (mu-crystallin family)
VLADLGRGEAKLSSPASMFLEGDPAAPTMFKAKAGYFPRLDACGFRVVGDVGPDGALGEAHFCYLVDPKTAAPRALVAHTALHRMRTAACALIALRALSASNASTFALIGAGKIGRYVAEGFADVFPGKRLLVASRSTDSVAKLVSGASSLAVSAASDVDAALAQAQSVIALTSSRTPVMNASAFRAGMTVIGMGEHHELPAGLFRATDRFVVDDIGFACTLGSLSHWIKGGGMTAEDAATRVDATLGGIIAGLARARLSDADKVLAIVQGVSIADIALAEVCRRRALEQLSH